MLFMKYHYLDVQAKNLGAKLLDLILFSFSMRIPLLGVALAPIYRAEFFFIWDMARQLLHLGAPLSLQMADAQR
jgi:hypothetical protein